MSDTTPSEKVAKLVKLTHQFFLVSHAGDIRGAQSLKEDVEAGLEDLSMDDDYAYHLGVVALLTQSIPQVLDRELIMECHSNQLPTKLETLKSQFPILEMMAEETDKHFKAMKTQRVIPAVPHGPGSSSVH